jgi:hypothetical protein
MSDHEIKDAAFGGFGPGAAVAAVTAATAGDVGNAGVAVGPPVMTIGERNEFIKSAVDLILASDQTEAEKTNLLAYIATVNTVSLEDFSEITGIPAFVIAEAAITYNVTFPGVTLPASPPPTLAEKIATSGIWGMMETEEHLLLDNDELLELYGYALDEFNQAKSIPISSGGPERRTAAEAYFEKVKAAISAKGLEIPTGTFTQNVTAAGRTVGGWMDRIFDFLDIKKPDYAVVQPGPGGTLVWGTPQGTVFSRIGTTPGGTITGVQTGIPALDRILSNVADVLTGRVEAGDILNAETIEQAVLDAAGDVLGVDAGTITVAGIKEAVTTVVDAVSIDATTDTNVVFSTAAAGAADDTTGATGADTTTGATGADTTPATVAGTLVLEKPPVKGVLAPEGHGTVNVSGSGGVGVVDVKGGAGAVDVAGGAGAVDVKGGAGAVDVKGGAGAVDVFGGAGSADVFGGAGAVDVFGGAGSADVFGGAGSADVFGGAGSADVFGGAGSADVFGGAGSADVAGGTGTLDALGLLNVSGEGAFETDASGALDTSASGTLDFSEDKVATGTLDASDEILGVGALGYSLPLPSSGFRGIREEPGDVVDIDYLYDVGGESIFAPYMYDDDEDEKEKGERLYVYQEGGTVANQDAVSALTLDALIRRPGEYGRNYFTPGEFVPTGTALGGAALDVNQIQIPGYTYQRELLPEFGGPSLTSTGTTIGGVGTTTLTGTIGGVGTGIGIGTQGYTSGVLTSSNGDGDPDTTEGSSFVSPIYDYLAGLGFGSTPQSITQIHVQDFLNSGFTLDELANALGTTSSQLQTVADYSAPVQTQTALQEYLSTLGYGAASKTVTKEDVTSFMGQEDFTLADIAAELGVSEDLLNQIYSYTPAIATSLTPVETYLIDKGYGGAGQAVSQADAAEFLSSPDFTADQIAQELGLTVADIENAATYGGTTATSTGLSSLQNYLIGMDFGGTGKAVTAADITAFGESDFTLAEIASALGLTVDDLNAVGASTAESVGLSGLQSYLIGMDFGGTGKAVTTADITAFGESDFTLAEIASALNLTVDDLNAVGASTATSTGLSGLQSYLTGMNFGGVGRTITTGDIDTFKAQTDFTLAEIASALNLTVDDLNAVGASAATSTGLSGLQSYLTNQGFGGTGRTVTTGDIDTFKAQTDFTLAEIASALNLTVDDLNAVGASAATATGLSGLQSYLIDQGFGGVGRDITTADITAFGNSDFSLEDIASALNLTVDDLNAVGASAATSTGLSDIQSYLIDQGFGGAGRTITAADVNGWKTAVATQSVYSLADVASALGVTVDDLNAISTYVAPSGDTTLYSYLSGLGFGSDALTITPDIAHQFRSSNFTIAEIASALSGVTEAQLTSLLAEYDAANTTVESAQGGMIQGQGYYLGGPTDGMGDQVPATIDGGQPAALSDGEFVVPADVVSHLGNGNSDAGAQQLYAMLGRIREERTGSTQQGPEINPMQMMPA